jgi:pimeloyl-ACP methyl ester carboxylesterase
MPPRLFALFVALALGLGTFAWVAPATPAAAGPSPSGLSAWKACGKKLQCAILDAPVDYAQPDGEQVGVAVIRRRAADPSRRLGSLVVNFGGPGDAGTSTLPEFVATLPAVIRAHYDIVSFDPRGTGRSRPITCVDGPMADALAAVDPTPNSDAELRSFYNGTHEPIDLVAQCVVRDGMWLAQVGSRNVARDLDGLRAALRDDRLNYLGYSYGTVIGTLYAQMFPDRVGRLVLDSPVDLSSSPLDELHADGAGFEHALDKFLTDCSRRSRCDFHNDGDPSAALSTLQREFEGGLTLKATSATGKPSNRRAGVGAFYTAVISALYDKQYGWPTLAEALHQAQHGDGSLLLQLADDYNGRHDDGTYDNINQAIGIILCDDRHDPVPSFDDFAAEYHRDVAAYPFLGRYVGSTMLGCDPRLPRPAPSETLGDVRVAGTRPILIVGTTDDPATPYAGAEDLTGRIAGSRLLTFESTEHTAYPKRTCISAAVNAYLVDGKLPPRGKRCAP